MTAYYQLKFFSYSHLPDHLQAASKPFCDLAHDLARSQPDGHPETSKALDLLLAAKDAAVRAFI